MLGSVIVVESRELASELAQDSPGGLRFVSTDGEVWERGRVRILEAITHRIGLHRISFPTGIKAVRGHELDRVYVRGGTAQAQRVVSDSSASDHSMLAFQFVID